jgi:hypothetical protein
MERIQRTITEKLLNKLPSDLEYVDPQWLGGFGIPGFLVERVKYELNKNLGDSIVPPKTDWADMNAKPVRAAWVRFIEAIEAEIRLPSAYAESVIESAVGDVLGILVEPRKNLPDYLFGNDKTLDFREASERAETIVVYTHFGQHLPNYMRRKQLDFIDRERFSSFISQLDEKLTAQYSPLNWAQLLAPLFELNNQLVDTELLVRFFRDKNRALLAALFERPDGAINQTQFIEMLSAPAVDHDSDTDTTSTSTPAPAASAVAQPPAATSTGEQEKTAVSDKQPRPAEPAPEREREREHEREQEKAPEPEQKQTPEPVTPEISEPVQPVSRSDADQESTQIETVTSKLPGSDKETIIPVQDAETDSDKNTGPEPELSSAPEISSESDHASDQVNIEPADIEDEATQTNDTRKSEQSQDNAAATDKSGTEAQKETKTETQAEPTPLWQQFRQVDDTQSKRAEDTTRENSIEKPASKTDLSNVKPLFLSKSEPEADSLSQPEPESQSEYDEERPLVERFKNDEAAAIESADKTTDETAAHTTEPTGGSNPESLPMWKRFISAASSVRIPELGKGSQEKPLADRFSQSDDENDYELDIDISNPLRIDEIKKTLEDKKKYYIKRFFKDDQAAFNTVIRDLAEMETWSEAGPYITKNVFKKNKIDPYSDEAVNFIDRLQSYFTSHMKK